MILKGNRCPHTGLWQVPLHAMPNAHQANSVTGPTNTAAELVKFSHAALFSPSFGTLKLALEKCYINNFPGLSLQTLKKYPPHSVATAKGHLDQVRANKQSTKTKSAPHNPAAEQEELFPAHLEHGNLTHSCYTAVVSFQSTGQVHTDQTENFQ